MKLLVAFVPSWNTAWTQEEQDGEEVCRERNMRRRGSQNRANASTVIADFAHTGKWIFRIG